MYKKILVPLDGSKLAECVIPHLRDLLKGGGNQEVVLVQAIERRTRYQPLPGPSFDTTSSIVRELSIPSRRTSELSLSVSKKQLRTEAYLSRIAQKLGRKGGKFEVQTKVLHGNPAEEIASFAEHSDFDLIVMASHGHSGVTRWAFGGVADKVFKASKVPVLMVKCGPGHAI
jgi:nucleotide-binding universal stress UspA family protein